MIDLHCHILPGLDDGARDASTALHMAWAAVHDGITDIVATPHTEDGVYRHSADEVRKAVERLQQQLLEAQVPLRLHPGSEVHIHPELIDQLRAGQIMTLGDQGRYLLLELPLRNVPRVMERIFDDLADRGITTILAHPERNLVLQEQPWRLAAWSEEYGVLAQLTAGSVTGQMGKTLQRTALSFFQSRLAHLVASDAHDLKNRRPELRAAYLKLAALDLQEAAGYRERAELILFANAGERRSFPC
ncbi:protein-tyrosine phosphatase [Tumebacillus sp. BK434]|uniref:tyrosine-protein phosphatase n=1 Tax=Tumebacillus sp. BK434 TaxID=2512169 RepID=UPI00105101B0|nr:CpsB/CapC family capsule biosynthesis tyrosine phosphatase [Tumebacillus sp. BK434]TCP58973.1 protein-tyrosine phosphatase [Tumebacillus sp. BK434]